MKNHAEGQGLLRGFCFATSGDSFRHGAQRRDTFPKEGGKRSFDSLRSLKMTNPGLCVVLPAGKVRRPVKNQIGSPP